MVSCHRIFCIKIFTYKKTFILILYPVFAVGALHSVALPHQKSSNSLKHENIFIITTTTWGNRLPTSLTQSPIYKKHLYSSASLTFSSVQFSNSNLNPTVRKRFYITPNTLPPETSVSPKSTSDQVHWILILTILFQFLKSESPTHQVDFA